MDAETDLQPEATPRRRRRWPWVVGGILALLLLLVGSVPAALWWLAETPRGRAFVAQKVSGIQPESGLRFRVGRIDGSLFNSFTLHDIKVDDLDGLLAEIPRVDVVWRPITLLHRSVSVDSLNIPNIALKRMWNINPRDPNEPILPDIDIGIGRFQLGELLVEKPVIGRVAKISASGKADIRSGRLLLDMDASSDTGDKLDLLLDAEPDNDRFDLKARLDAPAEGLLGAPAGLRQPLVLRADGAGSWTRWRGSILVEEVAAKAGVAAITLADLDLSGDNGRFRLSGEVKAAHLLEGLPAVIASPAIQLDATASGDGQNFDLRFVVSSEVLALTGSGKIDVEDNIVSNFKVEGVLKDATRLNSAIEADRAVGTIIANGPLNNLAIGWSVRANRIVYRAEGGPLGVTGLRGEGSAVIGGEGQAHNVRFDVSTDSITGLPPEQAALLQKARVSGTAEMLDGVITLRNTRLQTTQVTATGSGVMRPNGALSADINATLARFNLDGMGSFRVNADARIRRANTTAPLVANGRFDVRALSLANASIRDFLGGLPTATGAFALAADGSITLSSAVVRSPNLSLTANKGRYNPATGQFELDAAGQSKSYGPFTLVASGTANAPHAVLRAASPGLGIGLTNLVAELTSSPQGLVVVAKGDSPQGPLDGRAVVAFGQGPLRIDLQYLNFAGLEARGLLEQTPAGPFAGAINIYGRGLDSDIRLSAQGALQKIEAEARARNARLPLETPITITSGQARFTVVMGERPHVQGSFRATGVRRDQMLLDSVSGGANIRGTTGVATLAAKGRWGGGQPLVANARVQSIAEGYSIGFDGSVGNRALKLERPARIIRTKDGWQLLPARIVMPEGRINVAGHTGADAELRLELDDVDLSILSVVSNNLGLGGVANGQVVIRQSKGMAIPRGEANLEIRGLQRSTITGITVPVDVKLSGHSEGGALLLGARLSFQKQELGRLVLKVDPGAGELPAERFANGQLSGGVRYNGPVDPIWALVGLQGQDLKGAIAVAADFSGTPSNPQIRGMVRGDKLAYRHAVLGTEITDLAFEGDFDGNLLRLKSLTGRAHEGTITGSGVVRLGLEQDVDLSVQLTRARLANSQTMSFTLSGPLRLHGPMNKLKLEGDLRADSAGIMLARVETAEIPVLQVRREGEVRAPEAEPGLSLSSLSLNVRVRADDRIRVEGMGLDSIWRGDIRVRGTAANPMLMGTATMARGDFQFAGSEFELTQGRVTFNGMVMDSSINVQAQTQAEDVTAIVAITGTLARPDIRFSSTPALPEDEILSRLLFGTSVADLSVTEAVQLATAIAGLQSGTDTMGKVRRSVGVDRLRLVGENSERGMGTGIAIGKRLTRNIYVEVLTDSQGNTLGTVQLTLSRIWSVLLEVSSLGDSSVNVRYRRER